MAAWWQQTLRLGLVVALAWAGTYASGAIASQAFADDALAEPQPDLLVDAEATSEAAIAADHPFDDEDAQAADPPLDLEGASAAMPPGLSPLAYDGLFYVAAWGDDVSGDGSEANPWATLAKTADAANASGVGGQYLISVMSDLTSTACARYYDNSVTIVSYDPADPRACFTVTRGAGFAVQVEFFLGSSRYYNPAMLEIGGDVSVSGVDVTLTLVDITFDDAYRHEGSVYGYRGAADSTGYVQDAIVASYSPHATVVLGGSCKLLNFGGMNALLVTTGATAVMQPGSLIADIGATAATRQVSTSSTDYNANGDAAVHAMSSAHFYMHDGACISDIANAHAVKVNGGWCKVYINGEIAYMKGNKGRDTDPSASGRGFKSAVFLTNAAGSLQTIDPWTGEAGPAIIGREANIHDNAVKCGAVSINRSAGASVRVFGKVNGNVGGTGHTVVLGFTVTAGTNGGGLYVVSGGTIYLEQGSELVGNSVQSPAYGGAASIQQSGSHLVMNGGLVAGNLAGASATAASAGIVISKGTADFEMHGGTIDNGPNGLRLQNQSGDGTTGKLTLNAGSVSGVTIDADIAPGYPAWRHVYLAEQGVGIGTGYISVAGRRLYPQAAGFMVGNPNTAAFASISADLPQGWTMPNTPANVLAFYVSKPHTGQAASFAVPAPATGTPPTGYNRPLNTYFAAVQPVDETGSPLTASPVLLCPTALSDGNIDVTVPFGAYEHGATVAIVQPSEAYGSLVCGGPDSLSWHPGDADYMIGYTAGYQMPEGLAALLLTDGHDSGNTAVTLRLQAYELVGLDAASLAFASQAFELDDGSPPYWDADLRQLVVPLRLAAGWQAAEDPGFILTFSGALPAAAFVEGESLHLSASLTIAKHTAPQSASYLICSNLVATKMVRSEVTVRFDGNGGVVASGDESRSLPCGTTLGSAMPDDPSHPEAFTFLGWDTRPDGGGFAFGPATPVYDDITVYAVWQHPDPGLGDVNEADVARPQPPIQTTPPTGDAATILGALALACLGLGVFVLRVRRL
jgi:hypothetical protein